ncbi:MAG: prolipoprotein diacylglyceryl transferase [Candidatus Magasanikbacteria bacterium]|nr:prolipoprotein diacylglyceryl transferase [Candidatus Magasanikbacteria bacterium]
MIPYFQANAFAIGPITIQVWGLMVSLGMLAGLVVAYKYARQYFLSEQVILDLAVWSIIGGFIMARVFHVVFYAPDYYILHPSEVVYFWQGGASSIGGFVGAALAIYIFAKIKKFSLNELLPYFDVMAMGLWIGWAIGRIGCFLIHDHLGTLSHSLLAVKFPDGARFDLGLLDSILALFIFVVCLLSFKKLVKIRYGLVSKISFMIYAAARFGLDFLRASDLAQSDMRYYHLTPAQWGMIVIFLGLTFSLLFDKIKHNSISTGEVA